MNQKRWNNVNVVESSYINTEEKVRKRERRDGERKREREGENGEKERMRKIVKDVYHLTPFIYMSMS